jgi:hypothetical protein
VEASRLLVGIEKHRPRGRDARLGEHLERGVRREAT